MTSLDTMLQLLNERFGFQELRPGQQQVMEHLLAGRSAAAVFPTGGGKSLCYQLPALALDGLTLVVSPLIALMKDQIDHLAEAGVAAARLDSTLTADEYRDVMQGIRQGTLRLLYIAPERFNNERFREAIRRAQVALVAVDEAHCISEWGHNFRPDYLKLTEFVQEMQAERVLALTATATPRVMEDICRTFEIAAECAIRTPFHRSNLHLSVVPVEPSTRDATLLRQIESRKPGPTIVYVTLQKTAEKVARFLADSGIDARAYHAGMGNVVREEVQDWFMKSDQSIVVATIAFGMGVDKANIRQVYHYNLPKSLENYSQEIGRAGRDDDFAVCETLACLDDLRTLENFVYGDTPSPRAIAGLIHDVLDETAEFSISLHELSYRYDVRPIVVRTVLTYLELQGILRGGTPFYANYQFKPKASFQEILGRFEGERREFLRGILSLSKKAKLWHQVEVDDVAQQLKCERSRVVRALDYLGELELLEVKAAGVRHQYVILQQPEREQLVEQIAERMLQREAMEIERLDQIVALFGNAACLSGALGEHFGEPSSAPCGHCSACDAQEPAALHTPEVVPVDPGWWSDVEALIEQQPKALDEPRAIARFLCGIASPRTSRARLASHRLFGAASRVSFGDVMSAAGVHFGERR